MTEDQGKLEIIKEKSAGSSRIPPRAKVFRNFQDARGKSIGLVIELDDVRIFYKMVERRRHFHRNHRSWAIASSLVEELHREKVVKIVLDVKGEEPIEATLEDFEKYAVIDQFEPYEVQKFLHECHWSPFHTV